MPPKKGTKKAATTKCKIQITNRLYSNLARFVHSCCSIKNNYS